jgi:hypothetical protein
LQINEALWEENMDIPAEHQAENRINNAGKNRKKL